MIRFLKNYRQSLVLIAAIVTGALIGIYYKDAALKLKPLGDIFLNLLFTIVVPLVFCSIASVVAHTANSVRMTRIVLWMLVVFVTTGIIASVIMAGAVKLYSPSKGVRIETVEAEVSKKTVFAEQAARAVSVPEFQDLFVKKNMLGLIVFAVIIGFSVNAAGERARAFREFLMAGNAVMAKTVSIIMYYAPVGLGAYFAYLTASFGAELLNSYARIIKLYYPVAILYFLIFFSLCTFLAAGKNGMKKFWANILPPSVTAWATGSSIAAIPLNMEAAEKIGVPEDIREVVIPVGATIHMEGSSLAAMLKIAFLFGIYGMAFSGLATIAQAVGVALICGVVMSGIPGGGFLGEMMIVTLYGFPIEALPIISMIGTIVDPPATMVNSVGDTVSSMLVSRLMGNKLN